ncbi:MAG: T9SS type A sorting domain-containing protein [Ignavibacteriae bacterium]|nr:T9SS type A sorting domain-containing protein [Ignavibacteriota bacterium]
MKKIIILIFLNLNIIFPQNNELNEAILYYPLHIGDYWKYSLTKSHLAGSNYEHVGYASIEIVGDTVLENGKRYFQKKFENMNNYYVLDHLKTKYLRIDSTSGIVYGKSTTDDEYVVDSLLANIDDSTHYFRLVDLTTKNILGNERLTKRYIPYWVSSYDYYGWEISQGLGLTYTYYGDATQMEKYEYGLVYAKISGNEYGELVSVELEKTISNNFILNQNYPNPFNPNTTISFTLRKGQNVKLKIYNPLGEIIETLIDDYKNPGFYEVEFNGIQYSSGIYYYVVQNEDVTLIRKMLLLK